jgi:secondary thiamine-phosphate synthase enzyme
VGTRGQGLIEFTDDVLEWVRKTGIRTGLLTLHIRHTSASLLIQENADPEVQRDFERYFRRLVPEGDPIFRHTAEGPDDMPAHIRSALTSTTLSIPVISGTPALGTWQGIYLYEHRRSPSRRRVAAHLSGE